MPLSDASVRNAKPRVKPYKIGDSGGLYLQVKPNGSKLWRHKYRHLGIRQKLSIRPYTEISLSETHRRRDKAREPLSARLDPSREKVKAPQHAEVVAACRKTSIVGGVRPNTTSNRGKPVSQQTEHRAPGPRPTSCGCSFMLAPIG
jgi:hypothetical protein